MCCSRGVDRGRQSQSRALGTTSSDSSAHLHLHRAKRTFLSILSFAKPWNAGSVEAENAVLPLVVESLAASSCFFCLLRGVHLPGGSGGQMEVTRRMGHQHDDRHTITMTHLFLIIIVQKSCRLPCNIFVRCQKALVVVRYCERSCLPKREGRLLSRRLLSCPSTLRLAYTRPSTSNSCRRRPRRRHEEVQADPPIPGSKGPGQRRQSDCAAACDRWKRVEAFTCRSFPRGSGASSIRQAASSLSPSKGSCRSAARQRS